MLRAILELFITIIVIWAARAVLTSILKGMARASSDTFRTQNPGEAQASQASQNRDSPNARNGGDLHKDPVCGTYVAESTPFHRQISGQMFYYCSNSCREKHALVAR